MRLLESLNNIVQEHLISFHMPGHKNGRLLEVSLDKVLKYDITEIPEADHLHDAIGCLANTERELALFYSSEETKMLVNGSTVGILSMILGLTNRGDEILMNRNAHKSVYNAIEMNGLMPVYLMPELDDYLGIPINIDKDHFEALINRHPNIKACVLTYPTYEGLCFQIEELIKICHEKNILVLIDEAHGAHLVLHPSGPESALYLGADVVVQSLHKTLPAMTQTACLHFSKNNRLNNEQKDAVKWYLMSLQTSSPSYVLMASIDQMLTIIMRDGDELSKQLNASVEKFYLKTKNLKSMKMIRFDNQDITKIILSIEKKFYLNGVWDGPVLSQILREQYHIQVEYDSGPMCLLMASIANNADDFDKLADALIQIDLKMKDNLLTDDSKQSTFHYNKLYRTIASSEMHCFYAHEVRSKLKTSIPIMNSIGKIAGEYIIPYPPGIPLIVPGERISEETAQLSSLIRQEIIILR